MKTMSARALKMVHTHTHMYVLTHSMEIEEKRENAMKPKEEWKTSDGKNLHAIGKKSSCNNRKKNLHAINTHFHHKHNFKPVIIYLSLSHP